MLDPIDYIERERLADEREVRAEMWDRFAEPTAEEVLATQRERHEETPLARTVGDLSQGAEGVDVELTKGVAHAEQSAAGWIPPTAVRKGGQRVPR